MKTVKIYLRRILIDKSGYDYNGNYYGIGNPLYEAHYIIDDEEKSFQLRAFSRNDAKEKILTKMVNDGFDHKQIKFAK